MKTLTAREKVGEAIDAFYYRYPEFSNVICKWEIVERADLPTMATDGKHLFYNPSFVLELSLDELVWVLLHEAGHCFLGHHIRLLDAEHATANCAFDLALNVLIRGGAPTDKLRRMMLHPGQGDYARMPNNQDAEYYYRALQPPPAPPQPQDSQDSEEQSEEGDSEDSNGEQVEEQGDGEGQSEGESKDGDQSEDSQCGNGNGQSEDGDGNDQESHDAQGQGTQAQGDAQGSEEGSASTMSAHGNQNGSEGMTSANKGCPETRQNEQKQPQFTSMGEVLPAPDCDTEGQKAAAQGEWQECVAETMALAQMCGTLPGWLKSLGEKLLGQSEVEWRTILRRFLTKTIPQGTTYTRPSRRAAWRKDIILPAHRSKGGGDGVIISDVSGSLYSMVNAAVLPEIQKLLQTLPKSAVTLLQIDTSIRSEERFERYSVPMQLTIRGGGGTDLTPAFERVAKERSKHKWCICITDMYWSWQSLKPTGIPTLWVIVNNPSWSGKLPFGEVVKAS